MSYKVNISNGKITTEYNNPVQIIKMKFTGDAEFEVIPENAFAIYKDNELIVIFDEPIILNEIFNYKGYISVKSIVFVSMDGVEKIENIVVENQLWENIRTNWEDITTNWEDLKDSSFREDNQNLYRSYVKFTRKGKTYVDEKTLKKKNSTSLVNNHKHTYILDVNGNGYTSYNNGHRHEVVNYVVRRENKHIHKIKGKGKIRYGIK